jgi:hypothetical protein
MACEATTFVTCRRIDIVTALHACPTPPTTPLPLGY